MHVRAKKFCKMAAMEIKRDIHLKRLIASRHNGLIKVVTGIRRCGKSETGLIAGISLRWISFATKDLVGSMCSRPTVYLHWRNENRKWPLC